MTERKAVCLFSSAGIGELGIIANGIKILASNEVLKDRHALYQQNFAETKAFLGDIRELQREILSYVRKSLKSDELFLLYATPPCQGMSSNGAGRLRHEERIGNRSEIDERNRLVIPAMQVINELKPVWVLFENVPGMERTFIEDEHGDEVLIMDYISRCLGEEYVGWSEVVACSDFGIPQTRKRLIAIFTRDPNGLELAKTGRRSFFQDSDKRPMKTLRNAIGHLPQLDSRSGFEANVAYNEYHFVPIMNEEKYWWVSHTKEGDTAYNNQCVAEGCGFQGNALHRDVQSDGRWTSNKSTPIYCEKCGSLLPRPSIVDRKTGERRLIRGFHSAYRRMLWDEPARALTKNMQFEASDNKIHPDQNRVLSLYEAMILQTVAEYNYNFRIDGKPVSRSLVAKVLGESVPPKLIEIICGKMIDISNGRCRPKRAASKGGQLPLFS
jgi:DNA (cytosine-5)-methyltransferase 1